MKFSLQLCSVLLSFVIAARACGDGSSNSISLPENFSRVSVELRPNWRHSTHMAMKEVVAETLRRFTWESDEDRRMAESLVAQNIAVLIDSFPHGELSIKTRDAVQAEVRWCLNSFLTRRTMSDVVASDNSRDALVQLNTMVSHVRQSMQSRRPDLGNIFVDLTTAKLRDQLILLQAQPLSPLFKKPMPVKEVEAILNRWDEVIVAQVLGDSILNRETRRLASSNVANILVKNVWRIVSPADLRDALDALEAAREVSSEADYRDSIVQSQHQAIWGTRIETVEVLGWVYESIQVIRRPSQQGSQQVRDGGGSQ